MQIQKVMTYRFESDGEKAGEAEPSSLKPTETSGLAVNTSISESYDAWLHVEKS